MKIEITDKSYIRVKQRDFKELYVEIGTFTKEEHVTNGTVIFFPKELIPKVINALKKVGKRGQMGSKK